MIFNLTIMKFYQHHLVGHEGQALSMGGTVGGATTSTPEYLTETQYYSPSEFEDVRLRGKSQEPVLIGKIAIQTSLSFRENIKTIEQLIPKFKEKYFLGPLIDNNQQDRRSQRNGRTGDRRIDIDSNNQNSTKPSKNLSQNRENNYSDDDYGYYDDYEKVLNDYYAGDYDEESITEESEEELPTITRTPRTPTDIEEENKKLNENSRPLVGRKILSANPSQLHIESQHEMDHMMMMMLRNAIGK